MGDIDKMRKRHEKEVKMLQKVCTHNKTEWLKYRWAPGHSDGEVKVCKNCGKQLDRRNSISQIPMKIVEKQAKELIHYKNNAKTSVVICGEEIPTVRKNPAGITITHHFRNTTCTECIDKTLNNRDITSYVWGSMVVGKIQKRCGKAHCLITFRLRTGDEWEFETLCGIYDICGNWEFANKEWFEGIDGCKKCQKIYRKLNKNGV